MLSKNQIKRIQSLARKKGRREEGCFIAEGNKLVEDTLSAFECDLLLATSWIVSHAHESLPKIQEVDEQEMSKVSQLVTPPDVLAVYRIPEYHLNIDTLKKELPVVIIIVYLMSGADHDQPVVDRIDRIVNQFDWLSRSWQMCRYLSEKLSGAVEMIKPAVADKEDVFPVALDHFNLVQRTMSVCFQRDGDHLLGDIGQTSFRLTLRQIGSMDHLISDPAV